MSVSSVSVPTPPSQVKPPAPPTPPKPASIQTTAKYGPAKSTKPVNAVDIVV